LGRNYPDFQAQNCEILLILGESIEKAQRYVEILHLPFPVLSDQKRDVYHRYGLERAMLIVQRTASIVLDSKGVIQYLKTTTSPMVWLQESKQLLSFVQSMGKAT